VREMSGVRVGVDLFVGELDGVRVGVRVRVREGEPGREREGVTRVSVEVGTRLRVIEGIFDGERFKRSVCAEVRIGVLVGDVRGEGL